MHVAVWSKMINTWFGTMQIYWIGTVLAIGSSDMVIVAIIYNIFDVVVQTS